MNNITTLVHTLKWQVKELINLEQNLIEKILH